MASNPNVQKVSYGNISLWLPNNTNPRDISKLTENFQAIGQFMEEIQQLKESLEDVVENMAQMLADHEERLLDHNI